VVKRSLEAVALLGSLALIAGSVSHRLPLDLIEVLGFLTGALAVWLTVKQNVVNWPVGIANSAFYLVVFLHARLFADMSLQAIYIGLGFLGWYWWLRGGAGRTLLQVSRTGPMTALTLMAILLTSTVGLTVILERVRDSAPFWDALTTVMSLIAQFMLTRKLLENWLVWIAADLIYIGLYLSRGLALTALLYAIFLTMCVAGLVQWRATLKASGSPRISPWRQPAEAAEPVHV
jgi:nicotinamide mononucleotide transporter